MLVPILALCWQGQPAWEPQAEYQHDNPWQVLEVTEATADYVPFYHDPKKPDQCMPARISFVFTVTNKGKRAQRLPKFLAYEANSPKPWMRRTDPVDMTKEPSPVVSGIIQLNPSDRTLLGPGQSATLRHASGPAQGPWNPLNLEARLGEQVGADLVWVGLQRPFKKPLSLEAPDYSPAMTVSKPMDGKPAESAALWQIAALYQVVGKPVGGPVVLKVRVPSQRKSTAALTAGKSYDDDSELSFVSPPVAARVRPDFDVITSSIEVGCPTHKWQYRLTDANPSNDSKLQRRGEGQPQAGEGY